MMCIWGALALVRADVLAVILRAPSRLGYRQEIPYAQRLTLITLNEIGIRGGLSRTSTSRARKSGDWGNGTKAAITRRPPAKLRIRVQV